MRMKSIIVAAVLLVVALPLFSAIYMKLDGFNGGSKSPGHEGWIELESFSWGVTQSGAQAYGSGGGEGKAAFHEFTITMKHDKASPELMQSAMSGKHYPNATIDFHGQRFLLQDVMISSYQSGGHAAGEGIPVDHVKLVFQHDVTHESPAGGNPSIKKYDKVTGNAVVNGGPLFGAPSSVALRSLHLSGNNRAIIAVCNITDGSSFTGGVTRAMSSKQPIGTLTFAVTPERKAGGTQYKEMPPQTFTFTNATILGNQPLGNGCSQLSLNFSKYEGPMAGFDYLK